MFFGLYLTSTVWIKYHQFAHFRNKRFRNWFMRWMEAEEINDLDAKAYKLAVEMQSPYQSRIEHGEAELEPLERALDSEISMLEEKDEQRRGVSRSSSLSDDSAASTNESRKTK